VDFLKGLLDAEKLVRNAQFLYINCKLIFIFGHMLRSSAILLSINNVGSLIVSRAAVFYRFQPSVSERVLAADLLTPGLTSGDLGTSGKALHLQTKARYQREARDDLIGGKKSKYQLIIATNY
jgi:hypothetical protein